MKQRAKALSEASVTTKMVGSDTEALGTKNFQLLLSAYDAFNCMTHMQGSVTVKNNGMELVCTDQQTPATTKVHTVKMSNEIEKK